MKIADAYQGIMDAIAELSSSLQMIRRDAKQPQSVRHTYEQPPKPYSVVISVVSPEGYSEQRTYTAGSTWELSSHLVAGAYVPSSAKTRRWGQRPVKYVPNTSFPVRIQILEIR